jgi:hypothetical protein
MSPFFEVLPAFAPPFALESQLLLFQFQVGLIFRDGDYKSLSDDAVDDSGKLVRGWYLVS